MSSARDEFVAGVDGLKPQDEKDGDQTANGTEHEAPIRIFSGPEFIKGFFAPDYLIDGVLQRRYLYSLTGRTGDGKTSVAILIARCVEHGIPLAGHTVDQGRVLFLAGENPDDIRARIILSEDAYDLPVTDRLQFIPTTFSIDKDLDQIEAAVEKAGELRLVVVDTLAAYFDGDDDNSNAQLGGFARILRRLTHLPGGPAALVPCHPIKNASRDNLVPRGGGAFLAEVDGNLTLWSNDSTATQLHHHRKFRGPGFEPIDFKLETMTCERLVDTKGRHIPSVIAKALTESEAEALSATARSDEDALLDMLLNWPSGSYATWCRQLGWESDRGNPQKSRVNRALKKLEGDNLVRKFRDKWTLTKSGKEEALKVVEQGSK